MLYVARIRMGTVTTRPSTGLPFIPRERREEVIATSLSREVFSMLAERKLTESRKGRDVMDKEFRLALELGEVGKM